MKMDLPFVLEEVGSRDMALITIASTVVPVALSWCVLLSRYSRSEKSVLNPTSHYLQDMMNRQIYVSAGHA